MSLLAKALVKASGNRFIQGFLEKNVQVAQDLMGIGSGGEVSSSGEEAIIRVLRQKCKPPYCILDVGANQGQFLGLILDNMAGDDFSVHCFEPGHATFEMLVASSRKDPRIHLNNAGIGKETGTAVLHFNEAGSGLASLTKRRLDHFGIDFSQSETVEIRTIDDYCSEKAIDHLHLLKMDIEGHELDALAGAGRLFEHKAIDIIAFEFGGCNIDTRTFFQDFWYFLAKSMKLFRITPSGYLYPITAYREILEQFRTTNFIAISNG